MNNGWLGRQSAEFDLPVPLVVALVGAPQGSLVLDAPSPNGSLDGEETEGGAGDPHASSVLSGAAARCRSRK